MIELFSYRQLLYQLSISEFKARYKQSAFGIAWALIQPIMMALVFTYIFNGISGIQIEGIPYFIFAYAGILFWSYFATIVEKGTLSITANRNILERINCPRQLFLLSSIFVAFIDLSIGLFVLAAVFILWGYEISTNIIFLPISIFALTFAGLSISIWLSAITVWLRDLRFVVRYLLQLLFIISPIGYPPSEIPEAVSWITYTNPAIVGIELMRLSLFDLQIADFIFTSILFLVTAAFFFVGYKVFNILQSYFSDVI